MFVTQIVLPIDFDDFVVKDAIGSLINIPPSLVSSFTFVKLSLDCRKKSIHYQATIRFSVSSASGADLGGACGADLSVTSASGADLSGASGADLGVEDIGGADLGITSACGADLGVTSACGAVLENTISQPNHNQQDNNPRFACVEGKVENFASSVHINQVKKSKNIQNTKNNCKFGAFYNSADINKNVVKALKCGKIARFVEQELYNFPIADVVPKCPPVVIGSGPSGLFAGLILAKAGLNPIIIEQGGTVEQRVSAIENFKQTGNLNTATNVQFGEGGAGTFSDGKLNTLTKDKRNQFVKQIFADFGADSNILYLNKPHIGTDKLQQIIPNIRNYIISLGGQFLFNHKVVDFVLTTTPTAENGTPNSKNTIPTAENGTPNSKNFIPTAENGTPNAKNTILTAENDDTIGKNKATIAEKGATSTNFFKNSTCDCKNCATSTNFTTENSDNSGNLTTKKVVAVVVEHNGKRFNINTCDVVLATGHSSREIFYKMHEIGANLEKKPFSVGVRIEHPTDYINAIQYGSANILTKAGIVKTSDYKSLYHSLKTANLCNKSSVLSANLCNKKGVLSKNYHGCCLNANTNFAEYNDKIADYNTNVNVAEYNTKIAENNTKIAENNTNNAENNTNTAENNTITAENNTITAEYNNLSATDIVRLLPTADYKLSCHLDNGRSVYTFCMCPGGEVVNASSEQGKLCTNGMSNFSRSDKNSNSAVLVNVVPEDFAGDVLQGVEFQRKYEALAYSLTSNYRVPVETLSDFLGDKKPTKLGEVLPSPNYQLAEIKKCLPDFVTKSLKQGILQFDKKMQGFNKSDAVLLAIETRTSSPIRILRNAEYQSNILGIYPTGEGAGYAGGIMSSAVDGIKVAEKIVQKYKNSVDS